MTIRPINYELTFKPDLDKFIFLGKEIITFKIEKSTVEIVLDAVDLKIVNCELLIVNRNIVSSYDRDNKEEKLYIYLSQKIGQGSFRLSIEFVGILNDKLAGFYRSKYVVDGKEKYLATTQFEATNARRAFPCIDNPSYKATFNVALIIDKNLTAISNTSPRKILDLDIHDATNITEAVIFRSWQLDKKNKKMVVFERTPLMSTYLLYMGVGEFEFLEDTYTSEVNDENKNTSEVKKLRIVTTPGKKQFGKFALECAKKSLEYFEKYFDQPYPLNKLDLIAIPEFASGAMENWGAITFRENAVLFYPEKSSKSTLQRISSIIAHEIAHQWFGNLVTMKWWDDLWLNESFATYLAYKVLDYYWPEWEVWDLYVTDTVFEGMALDSLKSTHPIKVDVNNTSELDELFDEIAYEKGGSILRMLDIFLTEKIFKYGLRKYIKEYQYKNAEAKDLWNTLQKVSDKPILDLMQRYIQQVGIPEVKLSQRGNKLLINQKRFLYERNLKDNQVWLIPIYLEDDRLQDKTYLLRKAKEEIKLSNNFNYVNLNRDYSGFYITNYSSGLQNAIGKKISSLNNSEKIGLIHDIFALVLAGEKDLNKMFYFIKTFYKEEKSNLVLHYMIAKLTGIFLLSVNKESKSLVYQFSKKALEKIVGYEPKKGEGIIDTYLRNAALFSLTLLNDKKVAQFINKKFIGYLKNKKSLHPDLRAVVYSSSVWFNKSNYQIIKNLYKASLVQEEKAKFLAALGNTKNKKLIKETLEYSLQPEVPFSFIIYAVSPITRNPFARDIAFDWLVGNWSQLVKRSGGLANMLLRRILQSIIPVCGIAREKEASNFLQEYKVRGLEKTTEQVIEQLKINSRFVDLYKN